MYLNFIFIIPVILIHKAINTQKRILNVAGDGSAIRDFIYVDDVVDGILTLLKSKNINIPFNIGSGNGTSIKNLHAFSKTMR